MIKTKDINKAAELLVNSKYAIVLTGAGISTESGIISLNGTTLSKSLICIKVGM